MKRLFAIAASSVALLCGSSPAAASTFTYFVTLSGNESVPVNVTPAFGSAVVTVDDVSDTVAVDLSFSGLIGGNASAAHIHCCAATSSNAPVVLPFTGFPSATSGTYSNLFTGVSFATIAGIESGLAYINIHDAVFPGGEIRGDILAAVPEPETYALLMAGLAVLGIATRRQRAQTR